MAEYCISRLTAIGSKRQVHQFRLGQWEQSLKAKYGEPLEWPSGRFVCQFETSSPPLEQLKALSRLWPKITLLLDYEVEEKRIKGLAKAKDGTMESHQVSY
ncbi:MAG: hypothetical protein H0X66_20730 [Verrucomicrobia bacterium]|nr:hypothetical protein [Verrucomicrobiota bacterium]